LNTDSSQEVRLDEGKCIDDRLGRQVFRRATLPIPFSRESLAPDLLLHVRECPCCSKNLEDWKKKGYIAMRMTEARRIVDDGNAGESVRRRTVGSKNLFFKFGQGDGGVMVITNEEGEIVQIDDTTVGAFESFQ
jgi:hypothetical protein